MSVPKLSMLQMCVVPPEELTTADLYRLTLFLPGDVGEPGNLAHPGMTLEPCYAALPCVVQATIPVRLGVSRIVRQYIRDRDLRSSMLGFTYAESPNEFYKEKR